MLVKIEGRDGYGLASFWDALEPLSHPPRYCHRPSPRAWASPSQRSPIITLHFDFPETTPLKLGRGGHVECPARKRLIGHRYSITSSARARSVGGTSRQSALAVLRLITSSYLNGACTGRSPPPPGPYCSGGEAQLPHILQSLSKSWFRREAHSSIRIQEGDPLENYVGVDFGR
jgi:hypothetical protein